MEMRLKDAMLLEVELFKTKVLTSLLNKENETLALKKEVLEKASTIKELEQVNEKQNNQVLRLKSLVQPLRDTITNQKDELARSEMEGGEMQARVIALELKLKEGEEKADALTRKLEDKTRECSKLGEAKKSASIVEELLVKVKSDCADVKKKNLQIERELEKKRLERQILTFEQHLGNPTGKHRGPLKEGEVVVKRKYELLDGVSKNKKLKVVEHLKVAAENKEVATQLKMANEEVAWSSKSEVNPKEKSVKERCQPKISLQGERKERMSLVSEKGRWFLKSAVSTLI